MFPQWPKGIEDIDKESTEGHDVFADAIREHLTLPNYLPVCTGTMKENYLLCCLVHLLHTIDQSNQFLIQRPSVDVLASCEGELAPCAHKNDPRPVSTWIYDKFLPLKPISCDCWEKLLTVTLTRPSPTRGASSETFSSVDTVARVILKNAVPAALEARLKELRVWDEGGSKGNFVSPESQAATCGDVLRRLEVWMHGNEDVLSKKVRAIKAILQPTCAADGDDDVSNLMPATLVQVS